MSETGDKKAAGSAGGLAGFVEDKKKAGSAGGLAGSVEDRKKAGQRSGERRKAEVALVIKKNGLDKILSGKKVWEIRSSSTKRRGWIHLAQSKSESLRGY